MELIKEMVSDWKKAASSKDAIQDPKDLKAVDLKPAEFKPADLQPKKP